MSEKKEIEDIESKNKILTNQLTYIKKPYTFANILKNYNGEIDELHRFLFINTSFKPSSFRVSMNIARGIIKKIPDLLTNKKINRIKNKNNPDIYNKQKSIIKTLKIIDNNEEFKEVFINELIQEINKSNKKTKTKISRIIERKGNKMFIQSSEILKYLNSEYIKYLEHKNLPIKNKTKKEINKKLSLNEIIEGATLLLIGSIITLNNINKKNHNNLYSGLIITAYTFVKYPSLENRKKQKHKISISQTRLNDF